MFVIRIKKSFWGKICKQYYVIGNKWKSRNIKYNLLSLYSLTSILHLNKCKYLFYITFSFLVIPTVFDSRLQKDTVFFLTLCLTLTVVLLDPLTFLLTESLSWQWIVDDIGVYLRICFHTNFLVILLFYDRRFRFFTGNLLGSLSRGIHITEHERDSFPFHV